MLVVDDDAGVRKLIHAIFAPGFDLTFAEDCRQGITAIAGGAYDIVLTDFSMPAGNGLDVLRAAHKFLPNARLALVSSNPPQEAREEAIEMGAVISPKPFEPVELRDLIGGLVNRLSFPPRLKARVAVQSRRHDLRELKSDRGWSVFECVRCQLVIVYLHVGIDVVSVYPVAPSDACAA